MSTQPQPINLLEEVGLSDLPKEHKEELLHEAGEAIYNAVMLRVFDLLPNAQQKELVALLAAQADAPDDASKAEDVAAFLEKNVPDFARFMHEETESLHKRIRDAS